MPGQVIGTALLASFAYSVNVSSIFDFYADARLSLVSALMNNFFHFTFRPSP